MSVDFGENLKELRLLRTDFSQAQVAKLLGVDRSTYTNYELGKTEPPLAVIRRLSEIYHVSCDELINPDFVDKTCAADLGGLNHHQIRIIHELINDMKLHHQ